MIRPLHGWLNHALIGGLEKRNRLRAFGYGLEPVRVARLAGAYHFLGYAGWVSQRPALIYCE